MSESGYWCSERGCREIWKEVGFWGNIICAMYSVRVCPVGAVEWVAMVKFANILEGWERTAFIICCSCCRYAWVWNELWCKALMVKMLGKIIKAVIGCVWNFLGEIIRFISIYTIQRYTSVVIEPLL